MLDSDSGANDPDAGQSGQCSGKSPVGSASCGLLTRPPSLDPGQSVRDHTGHSTHTEAHARARTYVALSTAVRRGLHSDRPSMKHSLGEEGDPGAPGQGRVGSACWRRAGLGRELWMSCPQCGPRTAASRSVTPTLCWTEPQVTCAQSLLRCPGVDTTLVEGTRQPQQLGQQGGLWDRPPGCRPRDRGSWRHGCHQLTGHW